MLKGAAVNLSPYAKAVVALVVGVAGEAVTQGLISGTAAHVVAVVIAALVAAGVYAVPNKPMS